MTEEKIAEWLREGRGKGRGADYKPWLDVRSFSSRGVASRPVSLKTGRQMIFFSNVETDFFFLLEFTSQVSDIREQFPLDRDGTRSICTELGIEHPRDPMTKVDTVMTTDFLVTFEKDGQEIHRAYACKVEKDLNNPRTLSKLEVERQYFERGRFHHHLIVDSELPKEKINNLKWMRPRALPGCVDDLAEMQTRIPMRELSALFVATLVRYPKIGSLSDFCAHFDSQHALDQGSGLRIARKLLWEQTLTTDLNQPDLPNTPIVMFDLLETASGRRAMGG